MAFSLNNKDRPLRVAIVGSGPSGFYAAEALLRQTDLRVEVDMFERLPTPYGLVRGGVAPDHQKIKSVILVYEKIASLPQFRFFGNVKIGRDLQADDLRRHYDQIVYAVGNETDKKLRIPGEDLKGSHSATSFVGWYNSHPDYRNEVFDLSVDSVAVVGVGNVAMDVTRILVKDPQALASTDIADYALDALKKSKVRRIYLLGRRGAAQAAFSVSEIKEIAELPNADLVVDYKETDLDFVSPQTLQDPAAKKNVEFLLQHARKGEGNHERKVHLRFLVSPVEILGEGGRVIALKIEKNRLIKNEKGEVFARGTGEFETIRVGMVLRAVGYDGIPIPGVSFDPKIGHIPNEGGRVIDAQTRRIVPNEYVVGWAKRGPTGLIGTNRADSIATVEAMLSDASGKFLPDDPAKTAQSIDQFLQSNGIRAVSFKDWKILDRLEVERGKQKGKIRDKFCDVSEMLAAIFPAGTASRP